MAAGLRCYQNIWAKFLQPLRVLNCGIGGDKVQQVLWRSHNLPVVKSIKKVVVLCGTIRIPLKVSQMVSSKYGSRSLFNFGILPRDFNWPVTRVYIKEVNDILKTRVV